MISKTLEHDPRVEDKASRGGHSLSEAVYRKLVTELISLRLPPTTHLSVDSLARQFDVSQTPIRAALIRLEAEGLVMRKHNTGFSVAPLPSGREFGEIYWMRELLEPEAAGLAANNARLDDVRALAAMCDDMKQLATADTEGNYGHFAILDRQFHARIAQVGGNVLMQRTLNLLHAHMHLFRLQYHASVACDAIEEHLAVLKHIERRDVEGARLAMRKHIVASRGRMARYYEQLD